MTSDEAKAAFLEGTPVQHAGIEYRGITALIYRRNGTKVALSVELHDRRANSVSIADPARVTPITPPTAVQFPDESRQTEMQEEA